MTVGELKEYLGNFLDNTRIMISCYDNIGYEEADITELKIVNEDGYNEDVLVIQ